MVALPPGRSPATITARVLVRLDVAASSAKSTVGRSIACVRRVRAEPTNVAPIARYPTRYCRRSSSTTRATSSGRPTTIDPVVQRPTRRIRCRTVAPGDAADEEQREAERQRHREVPARDLELQQERHDGERPERDEGGVHHALVLDRARADVAEQPGPRRREGDHPDQPRWSRRATGRRRRSAASRLRARSVRKRTNCATRSVAAMTAASVAVRANTSRCRHPSLRGCEATRCPTDAARSNRRSAGEPTSDMLSASLVNGRSPSVAGPCGSYERSERATTLPGRMLAVVQAVVACESSECDRRGAHVPFGGSAAFPGAAVDRPLRRCYASRRARAVATGGAVHRLFRRPIHGRHIGGRSPLRSGDRSVPTGPGPVREGRGEPITVARGRRPARVAPPTSSPR